MPAHRCSRCDLNWPNTAHYVKCLKCGVTTSYMWGQEAMGSSELFEHWLELETPQQRAERKARFAAEEQERLDELARLEELVRLP